MLLSLWTFSLAIIVARCGALLSNTPIVSRCEKDASTPGGACGGRGGGCGLHLSSLPEEWEDGASGAILGGMDGMDSLGLRGGAIANPIASIRTGFRHRRAADPNLYVSRLDFVHLPTWTLL